MARTYRVYSYKRILELRTAAGLRWVIRGRGVEFVDPESGETLSIGAISAPPAVLSPAAIASPRSGAITPGEPPDDTAGQPPGVTPSHLIDHSSLDSKPQKESSSSEESEVRKALAQFTTTDDEAARYLLRECRKQSPNATLEEIQHFIGEKGSLVRRRPDLVSNPLGLLMRSVANCFQPACLEEYRLNRRRDLERNKSREQQYDEETARQAEEERKHLAAMLDDPSVPETEKAWMRKLLWS